MMCSIGETQRCGSRLPRALVVAAAAVLWLAAAPGARAQNIDVFPNVKYLECQDGRHILVELGPPTPPAFRLTMVEVKGVQIPPLEPHCGDAETDRRVAARAKAIRAFVDQWLSGATQVDLVESRWGAYYQLYARVHFDGKDLARELMARGYGRPPEDGDVDWCK